MLTRVSGGQERCSRACAGSTGLCDSVPARSGRPAAFSWTRYTMHPPKAAPVLSRPASGHSRPPLCAQATAPAAHTCRHAHLLEPGCGEEGGRAGPGSPAGKPNAGRHRAPGHPRSQARSRTAAAQVQVLAKGLQPGARRLSFWGRKPGGQRAVGMRTAPAPRPAAVAMVTAARPPGPRPRATARRTWPRPTAGVRGRPGLGGGWWSRGEAGPRMRGRARGEGAARNGGVPR